MSECNNIVDISVLPECNTIDNDSHLIVQSIDSVCRAKISDLVLGADNVDFYPELIEIVNKLDTILSVLQTSSGDWNNTRSTVAGNSGTWSRYNQSPLRGLEENVRDNIDDWNDSATVMAANSGKWNNTTNTVAVSVGLWNQTADFMIQGKQHWDQARNITLDGVTAIYEALEIIETSPWFSYYNTDPSLPPMSEVWRLYNVVATNSGSSGWE